MVQRQDDGATLREHLMSYARQTGKAHPKILAAATLPKGCEQLWADFVHLHQRRGSAGFGPSLITDVQIDAWQRVNRRRLSHWQIRAIFRADDAYIASVAPKAGAGK
jgi:hypothetical protein